MRSMTGFGRGTASRDGYEVAVQATSVNRRNLEVAVSLPRDWQHLEPEVSRLVRDKFSRGRIQVAVDLKNGAATLGQWNEPAVEAALDRLAELARRRGLPFAVTPELLFQVAMANRAETATETAAAVWPLVESALQTAIEQLRQMRGREGATLAHDLQQRGARLRELAETISRRAPATLANYRELLLQRLRQAGLELDCNDERVLKEIALFADRIDISEELTRVRSHLAQLEALMTADAPAGRTAEFIVQEIAREIHTIGSKANDLEIARCVIEFKNELERIREQMQNVE